MAKPIYNLNDGLNQLQTQFKQQIPDFKLANGELEVYAPMPIITKSDDQITVVDTTGQTDASMLNNYSEGLYIAKYETINKKNKYETQVIDYQELSQFTITKDRVIGWIPYLKWLCPIVYFFGLLYFITAKLVTAAIIALLGLILRQIQKAALSYGEIFIIAVYAMTLPILLQFIKGVLPISGVPYFGLIYYLLIGFYVWNGIKAVKQEPSSIPILDSELPDTSTDQSQDSNTSQQPDELD